ncbi:DHH family phosphoesterase [Bacillus subtilis]|uniref:DHH family phosphoesterase n=1 Tax=Bacillus subtilis TaxID=1423 RepID=UPI0021D80943|nr:DHHA1 domain-containing protein [Bacillus subtilis]
MFEQLKTLDGKQIHHFSHNDMDGYAPQIISRLSNANVIRFNHCGYGNFEQELSEVLAFFEDECIPEEHAILITDIAPKDKVIIHRLDELYNKGFTVVLLDHHDTNKWLCDEKPNWAFITSKLGDTATCGTELLYLYYKEKEMFNAIVAGSPYLANFVEQVRSYDTWDWDRFNNLFAKQLNSVLYTVGVSKFLNFQLEKIKDNLANPEAYLYTFNEIEEMLVKIEDDKENKYVEGRSKKMLRHDWKVKDQTYKVGVVFGDQYHSVLGNELNKLNSDLDFIAILDLNGGKGSLRTIHDHIHVGQIAEEIAGGGGHPKAAGFEFNQENMLFKIEDALNLNKLTFWNHQLA